MRYFRYEGLIASSEHPGVNIIVDDLYDDSKPPVALRVLCSGLAEYLEDRGFTDEEERYIKQTFLFDSSLVLHAVLIPSTDPGIPAKVISCADPSCYSDILRIFGPQELIDVPDPPPMDREAFAEWQEFQLANRLIPRN